MDQVAERRSRLVEPRWPGVLAVACAIALLPFMPARFAAVPEWVVGVVELVLGITLLVLAPDRADGEGRAVRIGSILLIAVITLTNWISLALLLRALVRGEPAAGHDLIRAALVIWTTNVIVFALWFWEMDGGGPLGRRQGGLRGRDFLFPQTATPELHLQDWMPGFIDYLFLAFTNGTAFSPTDTMPLTGRAKALMMAQSAASLATVVVVVARAVNVLA